MPNVVFGSGFIGNRKVTYDLKTGAPIVIEKKLTAKARKSLSKKSFVYPGERRYPIHDISHARNALSRVSQHGTPAEKRRVRSAVYSKYPSLSKNKARKS